MLISIILPSLAGGGAERVNLLLSKEFLDAGYSVDLVLMRNEGPLLKDVPDGVRIVDLKAPRFRQVWPSLHHYLRRERPDVAMAAMWPLTGVAGLALRTARTSTKLVVSEHTDFRRARAVNKPVDKWVLKYFGRFLYSRADHVIAVSGGVADSLRHYAGLQLSRIDIIHNPVRQAANIVQLATDNELMEWWKGGDANVLAVGSLKEAKAFDVLLQAHSILHEVMDARLIILGEGSLRPSLEGLVRELELDDAVRMPGFRNDPSPFYASADAFVLSSEWEGFGIVLAEALSYGVPVISTDCPSGPSEILAQGRYGRLVPVGDAAALASAMQETITEGHDRTALIKRARDFNPKSVANQYLSLMSSTKRSSESSIPRSTNMQEA